MIQLQLKTFYHSINTFHPSENEVISLISGDEFFDVQITFIISVVLQNVALDIS